MSNFSEVLEELRQRNGIRKQDLASKAGLSASYVSLLTRGTRENPTSEVVKKLAVVLELDNDETKRLFEAAGLPIPILPIIPLPSNPFASPPSTPVIAQTVKPTNEDWDNVPGTQALFGREDEMAELIQWVLQDQCRLVTVAGEGGIGKTLLTISLARSIAGEFDYILWRSLQDAPPFESILEQCLQLFSYQQPLNPHLNEDERIRLLLSNLKAQRCLFIFDNVESILREKEPAGEYREGYEDYGRLIDAIGSTQHQSCLIIATREMPQGITLLDGKSEPVRTFQLEGLKATDGLKILEDKGLNWHHQSSAAEELIQKYAGNPLALKVAAEFIRDALTGNIALFLASGTFVFQDIQSILEQQFSRLTELEQQLLYWLAIEREGITLQDLQKNFAASPDVMTLANTLQSLKRRSLIEVSQNAYTLQPVVLEFLSKKLVAKVIKEIEQGAFSSLESHALMKASAKEYIREAQIRVILDPIAQHLHSAYGSSKCEQKLREILNKVREAPIPGYTAGNLLNLLIHLKYDLSDYDFSYLYIWQAYLQGTSLNHVNFTHAHFANAVFTDNFTAILSVAFSPDNRLLAAGIENGSVRLLDASSGAPLRNYQEHEGRVRSVTFSPDGQIIASGSEDYTIRIWSIHTDQSVHVLRWHHDLIRSIAFSPDGKSVVAGCDDSTVSLWDWQTEDLHKILRGHTSRVRTVSFSPDGRFIASGGEDETVRIWDVQSGECLTVLEGHAEHVHSVSFSPDSKLLASGGEDQTVRIWDVESGNCITTLYGHTNQVRSVVFHPSGNLVASSSDDTTIRLWNVETQQSTVLAGHLHRVYTVNFSSDGSTLMSGSEDQTIRLWDMHSRQAIKTFQGYINQVRSIAFNPEGTILVSGGDDEQVRLWSVQSGQLIRTFRDHDNGIRGVVFSPDGEKIASCSDDRTVRLWNVHNGKCLKVLQEHTDRVRTLAYNHAGTRLASGGEDHTVRIWDTQSGRRVKILRGHTDWVRSVAFSQDDTILASGGEDYPVRVWNVESGECLHLLEGHQNGVRCVVFSLDGSVLASSSDDETIRLWDATTWQNIKTIQGEENTRIYWIISIAFSPDGTLLASGGQDGNVRLWDVKSGRCLKTMSEHDHRVYSVVFHPDGHMLASGSLDGTVRLWDVKTGTCLHILKHNMPYEGMNITDMDGLTETQKDILRTLGAVEGQ